MKPHIALIGLGVRDFDRAKRFYTEGLGWPILQEQGEWACFSLGDGSSALTLYPWDELAAEAGLPAQGDGFRGITFAYNVRSEDRVDEVLAEAEIAGGMITKAPAHTELGRVQRLLHRPGGPPVGGGDRRHATAVFRIAEWVE